MTLRGPDIASYQQGLNLLTLPDADFYLVKATEGASYVDPFYASWRIQAAKSGKPFIWYHFLTVADSAAAQAQNMLEHVGDITLPGMLDVETEAGKSPSLALVCNTIDQAAAKGLRIKLVYLPKWYWQQYWGSIDLKPLRDRGVSLIASNYPGAAGTGLSQYEADGGDGGVGWNAYGGMTPALWQYTDAANEQGQKLDYNAYRGTLSEFAAMLGEPVTDAVPSPTGVHRTLTLGAGGDDVRVVQTLLSAMGFNAQGIDGQYGQHTQAAVMHAQSAWSLAADGIVGPITWGGISAHRGALAYPGLRNVGGPEGVSVAVIQSMLWLLGFDPAGIDGVYGYGTGAAVDHFQAARGIKIDGIVGPVTWGQLTASA